MRLIDLIRPLNETTTFEVFHGTDEGFEKFDPPRRGSAHGTAPLNLMGFHFGFPRDGADFW